MNQALIALTDALGVSHTVRTLIGGRTRTGESEQALPLPFLQVQGQVSTHGRDTQSEVTESVIELRVFARDGTDAGTILQAIVDELENSVPSRSGVVAFVVASVSTTQETQTLWSAFAGVTLRTERIRPDRN